MTVSKPQNATNSTEYGKAVVNGLMKRDSVVSAPDGTSKEDEQLVLQSFRLLIADLCQQFGMGHPGGAIGMAAFGVALWKHVMRYAPHSPDWFNRDRFVLSNGTYSFYRELSWSKWMQDILVYFSIRISTSRGTRR